MIMANRVQKVPWSVNFGQGKPVESVAHRSTCDHTHKDHWPCLLCGHVFYGLQLVRIIEVPDIRGPDN